MTEDELIEAMAKAMFEDVRAHLGTTRDSPLWTWELAEENVKQYWRRKARVALQALKAKGCKVTERELSEAAFDAMGKVSGQRSACTCGGAITQWAINKWPEMFDAAPWWPGEGR